MEIKKNFYSKSYSKSKIKFGFFTRIGGISKNNYSSLNCSLSSGDNKKLVKENINIALKKLSLEKSHLKTVKQIHSNKVLEINNNNLNKKIECDGMITQDASISLAVLTADCCPIFIFDIDSKFIACLHAGWRGVYKNIVKNAHKKINKIQPNNKKIKSIIGPCLDKNYFEVDKMFKNKFLKKNPSYKHFFKDILDRNKSLFNMRALIKQQLRDVNINNIEDIKEDTYSNVELFFSHRRSTHLQNLPTGRMINIIGFKK
tara:strand:- start:74 stop:850 length:777 start_codon:yes stop_codon:yes gene_type:complete